MMIITEIKTVYRSKKKMEICLDNGTDFVLYKNEIYRYNLEEGKELSEEEYARILKEIFVPRARSRAMNLLLQQDRSRAELIKKLKDSGYPDEAVEEAVNYVDRFHYLDDGRLASNYVRASQKSKSEAVIRSNLKRKGISDRLIEEALSEELNVSPEEQIEGILKKRHYDRENADEREKAKQYRYLLGKGFKSSDILKLL